MIQRDVVWGSLMAAVRPPAGPLRSDPETCETRSGVCADYLRTMALLRNPSRAGWSGARASASAALVGAVLVSLTLPEQLEASGYQMGGTSSGSVSIRVSIAPRQERVAAEKSDAGNRRCVALAANTSISAAGRDSPGASAMWEQPPIAVRLPAEDILSCMSSGMSVSGEVKSPGSAPTIILLRPE